MYVLQYEIWLFSLIFCHSDFLDSCRANTLLAELDDEEDLPEPDDDDDENEDDNQEEQEYEEVLVRSRVNLGYHVHIHRVKPVVVSIIVQWKSFIFGFLRVLKSGLPENVCFFYLVNNGVFIG